MKKAGEAKGMDSILGGTIKNQLTTHNTSEREIADCAAYECIIPDEYQRTQ
jgi:hypothetical protein